MIFLLLSIVGSSCLPLLFKAFQGWQVSIAWAVSLNYLACTLWGSLFSLSPAGPSIPLMQPWIPVALLQGLLLAGNFYLLANTAQRAGVAIASLSCRLSVAIPVLLAIPLYGESLDLLKGSGICGALVALYLGTASGRRWGQVFYFRSLSSSISWRRFSKREVLAAFLSKVRTVSHPYPKRYFLQKSKKVEKIKPVAFNILCVCYFCIIHKIKDLTPNSIRRISIWNVTSNHRTSCLSNVHAQTRSTHGKLLCIEVGSSPV